MTQILSIWMLTLSVWLESAPAVKEPTLSNFEKWTDYLNNTSAWKDRWDVNTLCDEGILLGYASDRFRKGDLLYEDRLDNQSEFLKNWVVQQSQADPHLERYALIENGRLHVHDPRGTTIWFRKKLKGPVMITYRVYCPSEYNSGTDIKPRDINQFWMASDPENINPELPGGLFDTTRFDGAFGRYDILNSYYASTGGGNITDNNRTVRFRRYPRKSGRNEIAHVVLDDKDDTEEYLIIPDREYLIQLVAAEDIVQFIIDDKVVYELRHGDKVPISESGDGIQKMGIWGEKPFTLYQEGWFGFRMTRTHHIYRDFKVYSLIPK